MASAGGAASPAQAARLSRGWEWAEAPRTEAASRPLRAAGAFARLEGSSRGPWVSDWAGLPAALAEGPSAPTGFVSVALAAPPGPTGCA